MLLDSTTILCDGLPVTANMKAINTRFHLPARFDVPFHLSVEDDLNASVTFTMQESDAIDGTFTDVADTEFTLSGDKLKKGNNVSPYKIIPNTVKKQFIKMKVSGSVTAGKVLCALVRENDEPYTDTQYINKGQTVG